jgi:transcription termination factor Rho
VILLDSITPFARAYNTRHPVVGQGAVGRLDANALQRPEALLRAARETSRKAAR